MTHPHHTAGDPDGHPPLPAGRRYGLQRRGSGGEVHDASSPPGAIAWGIVEEILRELDPREGSADGFEARWCLLATRVVPSAACVVARRDATGGWEVRACEAPRLTPDGHQVPASEQIQAFRGLVEPAEDGAPTLLLLFGAAWESRSPVVSCGSEGGENAWEVPLPRGAHLVARVGDSLLWLHDRWNPAAFSTSLGRFLQQLGVTLRAWFAQVRGDTVPASQLELDALRAAQWRDAQPWLVAQSDAMRRVLRQVEHVAHLDGALLFLGPQGPGTLALALAAHRARYPHGAPFLLCPPDLDVEWLRGLEEGPVGTVFAARIDRQSTRSLELLARLRPRWALSTATAVPFGELSRQDGRRSAVLAELAQLPILVPAVRERKADLLAVVSELCRARGEASPRFTASELLQLAEYTWPGEQEEVLRFVDLLRQAGKEAALQSLATEGVGALSGSGGRERILAALRDEHWVVKRAASRLGVPRATMYRYLKQYGISRQSLREDASMSHE